MASNLYILEKCQIGKSKLGSAEIRGDEISWEENREAYNTSPDGVALPNSASLSSVARQMLVKPIKNVENYTINLL